MKRSPFAVSVAACRYVGLVIRLLAAQIGLSMTSSSIRRTGGPEGTS